MDGFRPSSKYLTIVDSVGAATRSNSIKIDWRCLRWEAQSYTSSSWYWESFLSFLQMLSTNDLDSPKFFCRKSLELCPGYKGYFLISTMLKLCPSYADVPAKKRSCKGGPVGSGSLKSLKMIFTLLAEVVAVHVRFIIIYIWHLSLKGLFALC